MNITHAVTEEIIGDKLEAIFNRQKELMDKYHDIEARSGLMQTEDCPVNLDSKFGQARIKDFSWRITEEVGEALDALLGDNDVEHYQEELVDGLHFLVEMTILAGLDPKDLAEGVCKQNDLEGDKLSRMVISIKEDKVNEYMLANLITTLVRALGMMCNTLKNKPWKQSHMKTDKEVFKNRLCQVWYIYIGLLISTLNTSDAIAEIYLKKSQVNKFRQRSNY